MKQLFAHLVGDYILQTHHEAQKKVGSNKHAATHSLKYTAAFVPITKNWKALAVIGGTHYLIDRYRLAKHVIWASNQLTSEEGRYPWSEAKLNGGFPLDTPAWLSTWLMIITDNSMHMMINAWAIENFGEE